MKGVLVRLLIAFAALAALLAGAEATAAGTPPAAAPAAPQRIVAVGDLHGDFAVWQAIARNAGVMNAAGHWAGGSTLLIQLGDIVDRGPDSLRIINSLRTLQREAPRTGGKAVVLLGNHEAMNLTGDLRYTTPREFASYATPHSAATRERYYADHKAEIESKARAEEFGLSSAEIHKRFIASTPLGWAEHRAAWAPTGPIGQWVSANPAILRVGSILFVHGGLSADYARIGIDEVNRRVASAMARADGGEHSVLGDPLGPLWYRGLVIHDADAVAARGLRGSPISPESELKTVFALTGARHMVVAHTPILSGIAVLYGGQLIRVDTGNSAYYHGQPSWLEIVGETFTPHSVARPTP